MRQPRWFLQAACRGDREFAGVDWHPYRRQGRPRSDGSISLLEAMAKAVCLGACEVRKECLAYALEIDDQHAILGGTTPAEREELITLQEKRINASA